jgi:hypothetical protein
MESGFEKASAVSEGLSFFQMRALNNQGKMFGAFQNDLSTIGVV